MTCSLIPVLLAACLSAAPPSDGFFAAVRQVESAGNDRALGDCGRSVGPYQCGLLAWLDGGGKRRDWPRLAYSRTATERVMRAYWARYGAATDEDRARCWNAGPKWRTRARSASAAYWKRVRAELGRHP